MGWMPRLIGRSKRLHPRILNSSIAVPAKWSAILILVFVCATEFRIRKIDQLTNSIAVYICEVSHSCFVALPGPAYQFTAQHIWFQSFISSLRLISNSPWLRHSIIFLITSLICWVLSMCASAFAPTPISRLSRLDWQSNYFPLVSCYVLTLTFFYRRRYAFIFVLSVPFRASSYTETFFSFNFPRHISFDLNWLCKL